MNLYNLYSLFGDLKDEKLTSQLSSLLSRQSHIIILGNGGSNSIASHIAQDYTKVLNKRALSFSDPSRLTCYINDYGQENAYAEFLKSFSEREGPRTDRSLVILISSSGESLNIINSLKYCQEKGLPHIVLTGFKKDNTLREQSRSTAQLDYWVDSCDYGIVECLHQVFLHSII
jgi:D-sedoheptulose 7-phosphate isomerase